MVVITGSGSVCKMEGGSITDNYAGLGLVSVGRETTFEMTGGSITGNHLYTYDSSRSKSCGVYVVAPAEDGSLGAGIFKISGDAVVDEIYLNTGAVVTIDGELSNPNPIQIVPADYIEGTQVIDVGADSGLSIEDIYTQFSLKANNGIQWKLTKDGIILEPDTVGASTAANLGTLLATLEKNDSDTPYKIAITDKTSSFTTTNDSLTETLDDYGKYVKLSFSNASFTSMAGTLSEFVTSLTIPASVTDVGFIDAGEFFSSFTVASGNETYTASSGILYANNGNKIVRYPPATTSTTVNIPSNITAIADGAFVGCKNIEAFTVSSGNTSFKVTSGGSFSASTYDVKAYQTANYFNYDSSISTTAPAFTITVDGKSQMNPEYTTWANKISAQYISLGSVTVGGLLTSYDETTLIACPPALTLYTNDDIKDMCGGYEKDQGGNTITYDASTRLYLYFDNVKPYALCGVKNVQSITLGVEATSVPAYTFKDCSGLKYVDLTTTGSTISAYTFCDCTALEEVAFKSTTINTVESNALYGCIGLKKLYFEAGETTGIAGTASDAYPASCGSVYIYGKVN